MKRMKIGVMLLALLLAAMAMVPMVSADQTAGSDSGVDVSKIQLPPLQFDNTSKKVVVTGELDPVESVQTDQANALAASTISQSVSTIPYGSIIYHSGNGTTTVFDSKGKQLFAAEDADAEMVFTPSGYKPATFVSEIPSGSFVDVKGSTIYVSYKGKLILTVMDENKNKGTTAKASTLTSSTITGDDRFIEGAESAAISNIGQFTADWNVPASPRSLYVDPTSAAIRSQLAIWNGVTSNDYSYLVQPVLEWAWKDKTTTPEPGMVWTGAS